MIQTQEIPPLEIDTEGNAGGFLFASARYEVDLMMATRMRDLAEFKRVACENRLLANCFLQRQFFYASKCFQ